MSPKLGKARGVTLEPSTKSPLENTGLKIGRADAVVSTVAYRDSGCAPQLKVWRCWRSFLAIRLLVVNVAGLVLPGRVPVTLLRIYHTTGNAIGRSPEEKSGLFLVGLLPTWVVQLCSWLNGNDLHNDLRQRGILINDVVDGWLENGGLVGQH